mmetsp:Transcript_9855/g.27524  ORF Transcript_9855/g.27524 Transcript_9855/m.27524 type:complete len:330 (-) Transcript_9855:164-1153(-)
MSQGRRPNCRDLCAQTLLRRRSPVLLRRRRAGEHRARWACGRGNDARDQAESRAAGPQEGVHRLRARCGPDGDPVLLDQLLEDRGDVAHVVDPAVVLAGVRDAQALQHPHHADLPRAEYPLVHVLQIADPAAPLRRRELLLLALAPEVVQVPVAAGHEEETAPPLRGDGDDVQAMVLHPTVQLIECIAQIQTGIDLLLGDARQLGAKVRQSRVDHGLHEAVKHAFDLKGGGVEEGHGELDDLLRGEGPFAPLLRVAGCLEVHHEEIIEVLTCRVLRAASVCTRGAELERCLVRGLFLLPRQFLDRLGRQAAQKCLARVAVRPGRFDLLW